MSTIRSFCLRLLLPLALLAPMLVLYSETSAADSIPPTNWPPVSLSDLPAADRIVTDPTGGVTVGCSDNQLKAFKSFSSAGATQQDRPAGEPVGVFCSHNSAVGKDGTVYVEASKADGSAHYVQAWRGNNLLWQYATPCGPNGSLRSAAMGANGNLYFVLLQGGASCSSSQLVGLTPAGQVALNVPLDRSTYGQAMAAYSGGLAMLADGYQAEGVTVLYVSYTGNVTAVRADSVTRSYMGKNDHWFQATVSGRVFVPNRASTMQSVGCSNAENNTLSLTALDPTGPAWTTPQLGGCNYVNEIHPMPSGGLVMRYTHTNTVGAEPTETLAAYGPSGTMLWSRNIQGLETPGYQVMTVDMNGNVAVQSNIAEWENVGWSNYRFPRIGFTLLSGKTGQDMPGTQFSLRGDSSTTAGPSYMWGSGSPALADGTAYVSAYQCTTLESCDTGTTKLYAFRVPGLAMDYPRGAILGAKATTPRARNYAALGDSFSVGEGVEPFEAGTDTSPKQADYNACHRSKLSYPRLLAGDASLNLKVQSFKACSGAKTPQITGPWPEKGPDNKDGRNLNEPAQTSESVLKPTTDIVTITIGGNDADFGGLATRCLWLDCTSYRGQYMAKVTALSSKLQDVYQAILRKAPNAKLYVIGYPQLLSARQQCTSTNASMSWLNALPKQVRVQLARDAGFTQAEIDQIANRMLNARVEFNRSEQALMRDFASGIDAKVQSMVKRVSQDNPGRITYIDPLGSKSPFAGHELCTAKPYFNGVDLVHPAYSFHPNAKGADAYKRLIAPYLSAKS